MNLKNMTLNELTKALISVLIVGATLYIMATGGTVPDVLLLAFGIVIGLPLDAISKNEQDENYNEKATD